VYFKSDERYRMPVFFGPSCGPRRGPNNTRFDYSNSPRSVASVKYLTDASALEPFLPEGFSLVGSPVVSIDHYYLRNVPWLAGRDYSALGVSIPARFTGEKDDVKGPLLLVLWENLTDAILTGRDELGYSKLFADLPGPSVFNGKREYAASWQGHQFLRLKLSELGEAEPAPASPVDGILHYRYFPQVNTLGESHVSQACMTPSGNQTVTTDLYQTGLGEIEFMPTTWEQMPTQYQVVNQLAALPINEVISATYTEQRGAKELSDVRMLF